VGVRYLEVEMPADQGNDRIKVNRMLELSRERHRQLIQLCSTIPKAIPSVDVTARSVAVETEQEERPAAVAWQRPA
jgi:hypothetical protein